MTNHLHLSWLQLTVPFCAGSHEHGRRMCMGCSRSARPRGT